MYGKTHESKVSGQELTPKPDPILGDPEIGSCVTHDGSVHAQCMYWPKMPVGTRTCHWKEHIRLVETVIAKRQIYGEFHAKPGSNLVWPRYRFPPYASPLSASP